MKIQERFLWIAALIVFAFFLQSQTSQINDLGTLLTTYEMESQIQEAQINDFSIQLDAARDASHTQGFEAGRTQAGIALVQGGSLYNYADGYHAAMSQRHEEAHLEVAESLMAELNNLRKMVPRLLNQVNKLSAEKDALILSSTGADLLNFLLEEDVKDSLNPQEDKLSDHQKVPSED